MAESTNHASHGISRTSIFVAAGRAVGAREPDPAVRNPDYVAETLLGDPAALDVDHPAVRALSLGYNEAMTDLEVVNHVRMMMIRTRFIDEALTRAVRAGATQVVILGAGFDSHAYRCLELLQGVRVFEVDRPATQEMKRRRVIESLGGPPANLTYVAVDFQHDDLRAVLARHDWDPAQQTFFILEGVTMYLPEAAVRDTLQFVASHPPGSGIVFDYVYQPMIELLAKIDINNIPAPAKPYMQRFLDLIRDEPWVFGIPAGGEREYLSGVGLDLRDSLTVGDEESSTRYLTKADGSQVGGEAMKAAMVRMARAQAEQPAPAGAQPMTPERIREQRRLMAYRLAEAVVRPTSNF